MKWSITSKVIQGHIRWKFVLILISWRHIFSIKLYKTETSLLCYEEVFFYFKTLWPHYNLDLRSYGQLLSLFSIFRNELIIFGWEKLLNLFIFFIMILPLWNCLFFSSFSSSIAFFKKKIRVNMAKIWLKRYIF